MGSEGAPTHRAERAEPSSQPLLPGLRGKEVLPARRRCFCDAACPLGWKAVLEWGKLSHSFESKTSAHNLDK